MGRRRPAPAPRPELRPRPRIVAVSDRWERTEVGTFARVVTVALPDGSLIEGTVADDHPALLAFLARAAAAVAA